MKIILASGSAGRKSLLESLKIPFEIVESRVDEEKIQDCDPIKLATLRAIAKTESVAEKLLLDSHGLARQDSHGGDERRDESRILVIGADTVGFMGEWIFGKPKSREEAEEMMRRLSGRTHRYISAFCALRLSVLGYQLSASGLSVKQFSVNKNTKQTENRKTDELNSENPRLQSPEATADGGQGKLRTDNRIVSYDISSVTFRKLSATDISTYLDCVEYLKLCGAFKLANSPQDFVVKTEGSISNIIGLSLEKIMPILRDNFLL